MSHNLQDDILINKKILSKKDKETLIRIAKITCKLRKVPKKEQEISYQDILKFESDTVLYVLCVLYDNNNVPVYLLHERDNPNMWLLKDRYNEIDPIVEEKDSDTNILFEIHIKHFADNKKMLIYECIDILNVYKQYETQMLGLQILGIKNNICDKTMAPHLTFNPLDNLYKDDKLMSTLPKKNFKNVYQHERNLPTVDSNVTPGRFPVRSRSLSVSKNHRFVS